MISILIVMSALPLVRATANTLLCRTPIELEATFEECLVQISRRPNVRLVQERSGLIGTSNQCSFFLDPEQNRGYTPPPVPPHPPFFKKLKIS